MKKTIPAVLIIATTLIVGLMNTVFIRTEDTGSWKNYVGYLFLLLAAVNLFFFIKNILKKKRT